MEAQSVGRRRASGRRAGDATRRLDPAQDAAVVVTHLAGSACHVEGFLPGDDEGRERARARARARGSLTHSPRPPAYRHPCPRTRTVASRVRPSGRHRGRASPATSSRCRIASASLCWPSHGFTGSLLDSCVTAQLPPGACLAEPSCAHPAPNCRAKRVDSSPQGPSLPQPAWSRV